MLSDGILQSIGYILLGTAIGKHPEINKPEHYVSMDFGPDNNDNYQKYRLNSAIIGKCSIGALVEEFDKIITDLGDEVVRLVNSHKIVAGTLRINLGIVNEEGKPVLSMTLLWAEEK